mmetsp:Transcript_36855/g.94230  ORF Transcript_36855/g.94230 Transcript_36855/m.94230 type:complete len:658 (+) Transcript_36855:347-2320(+)|eukprot:jgi/Tetstr1/449863/TSEL_036923.t2
MWSSAPSPLLSGTKARAVSSPAKIADLPASMPGVLLPSARATVAPAAKASAEHRTAANSNTYYVTCIVCSVVLVLLVLINNPIKLSRWSRQYHVEWQAHKPSLRRALLQAAEPAPVAAAQPRPVQPASRPGRLARLAGVPWLLPRHSRDATAPASTAPDSAAATGPERASLPARAPLLRRPVPIRALPPLQRNQTVWGALLQHASNGTGLPHQGAAPGNRTAGLTRLRPQPDYAEMIRAYRERMALMKRVQAELYGSPPAANVVNVSDALPPQDLGAETYGCWGSGYMQDGCPQKFMDGLVRPTGANGSGPYVAYMQPARSARQQTHAPSIITLPNGDMLAAWFDGVEGMAGVGIVVSRLLMGPVADRAWSKPSMVSLDPHRSAQNPVLWYDADTGKVFLMHTSQRAMMGQGTSDVRWLHSADLGLTWSEPEVVFRRRGAFVRNSLVVGARGEWLLPMYHTPGGYEMFHEHYCTMRRSDDHGASWVDEVRMSQPGQFLAQPTTVRLSQDPPVLVTWMRDRRSQFIYTVKSADDGWTWSNPKRTRLPNNNSGIQALRLLSGTVAMVFNNHGGGPDRWPITVALSYDGGETWAHVRDLDREPLALAYPALTQTPDGLIHIMYSYHRETIKYVAVTEEWIKAGTSRGIFKGDKDRRSVAP